MGEYCGAETAQSFGDPRQEFAALRHGCGVYDLGWQAQFRIGGKDRVRWLNGMVSNNIRDLPPGRGNYNFLLNAQGHIQGDLYVYNLGDYFLAGAERDQLNTLMTLLRRYIIMDKVELADMSGESAAIGVQGPHSRAALGKAGCEGPLPQPMEILEIHWRDEKLLCTRIGNERNEIYQLWMLPAQAPAVWQALVTGGGTPVGTEALEMFRVAAGVPRYGVDIRERDLPQETAQDAALNFTKGCYIGQEIVERIRSRGSVHRTLTGLVLEGTAVAPGSRLEFQGKNVGEITSVGAVPADGGERLLALAYVRREAAQQGTKLNLDGTTATVAALPFPQIFPQD